jgi:hypothetical protein
MDCAPAVVDRLEHRLQKVERNGIAQFGLHRQSAARHLLGSGSTSRRGNPFCRRRHGRIRLVAIWMRLKERRARVDVSEFDELPWVSGWRRACYDCWPASLTESESRVCGGFGAASGLLR